MSRNLRRWKQQQLKETLAGHSQLIEAGITPEEALSAICGICKEVGYAPRHIDWDEDRAEYVIRAISANELASQREEDVYIPVETVIACTNISRIKGGVRQFDTNLDTSLRLQHNVKGGLKPM